MVITIYFDHDIFLSFSYRIKDMVTGDELSKYRVISEKERCLSKKAWEGENKRVNV